MGRRRRDRSRSRSRDRSRRDRSRRDRSRSRDRKRRRRDSPTAQDASTGWVSRQYDTMKDSENPFAKAQREEKEAKQRLESRKRRKSPSPPQDDSTADKAKAVAEMISARLKANAPKTAEELEAERALEREAEARRVEEEARARKERIESGRKKVVEEVVEEKKASWTLGENAEGADAEGVDEDDDDVLAEFTEVSQSTVVEATTSSIKESAALLKQKRFQNKSSAVKDFLPATTTSDDPLEGFLASFSTEGTESPMPSDIDLQRARSDPLAAAFDAPQRRSNAITLDEILAGESGRGGGWESDSVVSASEEPPRIYDEDESDDEDLTTRERVAAVQRDALQVQQEEQAKKKDLGRCFNDEGDVMEEKERKRAEKSALEVFAEQLRRKELKTIDHASQDYLKIRKNFYVVPRHLAKLSADEVSERREADETKVRGKGCPPPVTTWGECGLPDRVHTKVLEAFGDDSEPFPIQKQALPALMSGRDVIGIAKTGSGKTLAFALPLLRHVSDQPPVIDGSEGPVALILAPARELALQIYRETKRFASVLGLRCTAVYGGAQVAQQIADLKRGAEVVVATPGRLIDILTMQQGRLIALSRVSFVVLDEADRMFDMGCEPVSFNFRFEPQIAMVLRNVRPDRQTALFSATFPRAVEQLARKALQHPLEIVCGGKSVASDTVDQYVEVRPEQTKFMRLLQLLGVWFERGSTLVFVDTQLKCDSIYEQLVKAGYPSLSLHGGKEQDDRASTIKDFQDGVATVLVATSVAGRGLDVPAISCVVNYSCPNHLEDYVHRVGRTGRAGRKGTAYTFLDPQAEDAYAPILKKALTQAKRQVPPELDQLAKKFVDKTKTGEKKWAPSGFAGRGFKFDDDELDEEQQRAKAQRKLMESEMGLVVAESHLDDDEGPEKEAPAPAPAKEPDVPVLAPDQLATNLAASAGAALPNAVTRAPQAAQAAVAGVVPQLAANVSDLSHLSPVERAKALAARFGRVPIMAVRQAAPAASPHDAALARARALAAGMTGAAPQSTAPVLTPAQLSGETAYDELDINDYPGEARLRATNRDVLLRVQEETGAALINRGAFVAPGTQPPPGQRRLYLAIEGQDARAVALAKAEMKRVLNEETLNLAAGGSRSQSAMANYGKYSLV